MPVQKWDVSLSRISKDSGTIQVALPAIVARALLEKGYNRAEVTVTEDGILIMPYKSEGPKKDSSIDLPF